jgi:hypothetical protein
MKAEVVYLIHYAKIAYFSDFRRTFEINKKKFPNHLAISNKMNYLYTSKILITNNQKYIY